MLSAQQFSDATTGALCIAIDIRIFKIIARTPLIKKWENSHFCFFVYAASVASQLESSEESDDCYQITWAGKYVFICIFSFFNSLRMQLEMVSSQRADRFANKYLS